VSVADEFADVFKSVPKDLHTEKKRREQDARRAQRVRYYDHSNRVTLKDAVFAVMDDAVAAATGNGALPTSARTLYYQVRPRVQEHTDAELNYGYFSQTLLTDYQMEYDPIDGLYYEPRGELHEPHTGTSVPLVASYAPPDWTFDKILYVEKQGLWPVLKESKLAERYDMAIIAGNGYATEACRHLLAQAEGDDSRIFVLHDADNDGYNIARTLGEETRRMPDHYVEVVDLGLTVADAIEHGLPTETFTRRKRLPYQLALNETERAWFEGRPVYRGQYACTRVELNAFSGPDLITYIEDKLAANDATAKLVPPDDVIKDRAKKDHADIVAERVEEIIAELVDTEAITGTFVDETAELIDFDIGHDEIAEELERAREEPWGSPVKDKITVRLDETGVNLRDRVRELLTEAGIGGAG
jgi:hypothetical protein